MISIERKEQCCGCNACGDVCPQSAIDFVEDNEGFLYPSVNTKECVNCGLCDKVCPIVQNDKIYEQNRKDPNCFAGEHKSIEVQFSSTTGGMFSAFAELMYAQGGYVGGAIHNEDFSVSEYISNNKEDLRLLRRSKDLQSDSRGFYKKIKNLLENDEKVLVCALPCQIAAIKQYLMKDYKNLITVDLICLGVNSPKVWMKYLKHIEMLNDSKIVYTENKSKEYGWKNLTQKFVFDNGKEYFDTSNTSLFIKGFIKSHLYCRPSCYECQFKGFPRVADISIGDFWGLDNYDKSYNSNMGTSVVMVNSKKGENYFEKAKKRIKYKQVPLSWAVKGNPALTRSLSSSDIRRELFFEDLERLPFEQLIEKYQVPESKTLKSHLRVLKRKLGYLKAIAYVTQLSPMALYQSIKYSGFKNLLHRKGILFGRNCVLRIDKTSNIKFEGLLVFGSKGKFPKSKCESRLYIGKNASLTVLGDFEMGHSCDIEIHENAQLIIHGKKLGRSDSNEGLTIVCGEKIEIGADVGIGRNVSIRDTNGNHYMSTTGYRPTRPVDIGEKAWLCESCTILPGVKIGNAAIIGANSTVAKSIPSHALASGFPAVVVQENVLWKC